MHAVTSAKSANAIFACAVFLGWVTYRILHIKKSVSFSQKQSKTQDNLPNDAAVKEKQAAAGMVPLFDCIL